MLGFFFYIGNLILCWHIQYLPLLLSARSVWLPNLELCPLDLVKSWCCVRATQIPSTSIKCYNTSSFYGPRCNSRLKKGGGPAAPPSVKLMSSTHSTHFSGRCSKAADTAQLHSPRWAKHKRRCLKRHELSEQPGWKPPDRTGGGWDGPSGQRRLGEPGLLRQPSANPQSGQHHLQPQPSLPGLHGRRVQAGADGSLPRGAAAPRAKPGEETKRLLLINQRWGALSSEFLTNFCSRCHLFSQFDEHGWHRDILVVVCRAGDFVTITIITIMVKYGIVPHIVTEKW